MKQAKKMPVTEKPVEVKSIMERVKTFEDACHEVKLDPKSALPYENPETEDEEYMNAIMQLRIISRALNEGKRLTLKDARWFPYYYVSSGFVFHDTRYGGSAASTASASALCFKTSELAEYAGKQFIDIYKVVCA
jgi:hypothetical protein